MSKRQMPKISLSFCTFLLSLALVLGFNIFCYTPTQAEINLEKEERDFIKELNDYRNKNGLKDLKISKDLSKAALAMAEDMADHPDTINHEHKDSQGRLPSERAAIYGYTDGVGENLAAGYETAEKALEAWKGSAEHKANMVSRDYEVMGVALVTTGNNYKWYWVNMFGDKESDSDLMSKTDYNPMIKLRLTVVDSNGKAIKKPKITIMNNNKRKITSGKANTKGKKTFSVIPKDQYYVKADATGYKAYTKRVKPGDKDDVTVKIWLEKS